MKMNERIEGGVVVVVKDGVQVLGVIWINCSRSRRFTTGVKKISNGEKALLVGGGGTHETVRCHVDSILSFECYTNISSG